MFRLLCFLVFSCLFWACGKPQQPPVVSFYYWKTTLDDANLSDSAYVRFSPPDAPVFLRLFDVDYSAGYDGPVPVGELEMQYIDRPVVPVVFITNRVFSNSKQQQLDSLPAKVARKISQRIDDLATKAHWTLFYTLPDSIRSKWGASTQIDSFLPIWRSRFIHEIQIDCDWTAATQPAYFRFLEALKKQPLLKGRTLSCTVRLHQFRDRKTNGIPPVERGTLMCYNMESPKDTAARNAIFDPALLKGYIEDQPDYPLPLDVALPVFSWGAWFRSGEFRGLLSNWDAKLLSDTARFTALGSNLYQLKIDTVWSGDYLREGDMVRLDAANEADVLSVKPLLKPLFGPDSRLLIFDWDTTKIDQYERLVNPMLADW